MSTGTLALIILAAILVQVAAAALIWLLRRGREHQGLGPGRERFPTGSRPTPLPSPTASGIPAAEPAWKGFREFTVQRREYEDVNRTVCSFYLAPVDGKPLPPFRPGQFLTFRLSIGNQEPGEPATVIRCYSLSDAPGTDHYRVSIKRVPAPTDHPGVPPGLSSGFFHDRVHEGSRLLVRAPSGHFHLQEDEPLPIVLIGGGIGITPMLSILEYVLEHGGRREVWLYYGVRNGNEHIMKERLRGLAGKHAGFHLHVCYSAPREDDVEGVDYQHHGRIDIALLRNTLRLMRHQFYVCGPRPLMESLVPALEAWGVDNGDIHYESFGHAALPKH
ncbi:MAG: FAD/NAD(P)-binding oxidoreductase, partial [Gammaproteobacteria bacterium]|nr:FAD/NAD(P)-binding oxidoreductase [Gammaproteobacteria bacterium]